MRCARRGVAWAWLLPLPGAAACAATRRSAARTARAGRSRPRTIPASAFGTDRTACTRAIAAVSIARAERAGAHRPAPQPKVVDGEVSQRQNRACHRAGAGADRGHRRGRGDGDRRRPHQCRRLLRQQHRHLQRGRRRHSRRARRQGGKDRTRARPGQDHLLVQRQIQGACRRESCGPVAVTGDASIHPVDAGLHGWAGVAVRRGDPAGTHRGPRGVGRLPPAAREADAGTAAHQTGRNQHIGRIRQHRGRQLARPGPRYPRHHHQTLASDFRAGRSQ